MSMGNDETILELIHRRRRQVLVHSILYYAMDSPILDDATFDSWARELAQLQHDHPALSRRVKYHRTAFKDFDGSTGFHLPLSDPRARTVAHHLLARAKATDATAGSVSPEE